MILVDTNVLLDLATGDARWADWSQRQLEAAAVRARLIVNPVIYAELSVGFLRIEELDAMLRRVRIDLVEIPRAALFLAGKAFLRYRRRGGTRTGVLPDFFVGAHASVLGIPLITRDAGRYGEYFPKLALRTPGT